MSSLVIHNRFKTQPGGGSEVTFVLEGNLDNSTAPSLESRLGPALAAKPTHVVFDLAGLKMLTSLGIRIFFSAMKQQKQHAGHVSFINLQPQIKEVFAIMGSIPDMRVFRDQAELDAYLIARQRTYEQG